MARDTRDRILDVALQLFARQGSAGTTVVEIERAAGLSAGSGSFYRHFKDKDDVLRAAVDRELARVQAARAGRAPSSSLEEEYLGALSAMDDLSNLIGLLAREGTDRPEILAPVRSILAEGATAEMAARVSLALEPRPDALDVEAVAAVAVFALVGHHLAERFFGLPVGVSRERFAGALAALTGGGAPGGHGRGPADG